MELKKPIYKTWIRRRVIIMFFFLTLFSFAGIILGLHSFWLFLFLIPTIIFGYIFIIIFFTNFQLSVKGGNFQNKIHDCIIDYIPNNCNKILDIGCGSGNLSIKIAKKFNHSQITGVDYWGNNWEYSKLLCENNSILEGVAKQITFLNGTASKLQFNDNSFDIVVSCLTFHEVRDVKEKIYCLAEAIRVLKPGGRFIFFDLFNDLKFFPTAEEIKDYTLKNNGKIIEFKKLNEYFKLPFPLNNKKVLGYGVMIFGAKNSTTVVQHRDKRLQKSSLINDNNE